MRELRGMMVSTRNREEQRQWLWSVGVVGVMGGVLLWFLLTALLPWGAGTWLAGLAYSGRWNAGQVMMQDADRAGWDRMVRLYDACPKDRAAELCAAAMAVKAAEDARQPAPRSRLGQDQQRRMP